VNSPYCKGENEQDGHNQRIKSLRERNVLFIGLLVLFVVLVSAGDYYFTGQKRKKIELLDEINGVKNKLFTEIVSTNEEVLNRNFIVKTHR
jgi:hypothetical protein